MKSILPKVWLFVPSVVGNGGTYNTDQPEGRSNTLTVNGSGFGPGPTIAKAAKWTNGVVDTLAQLDSTEHGGPMDKSHYSNNILPPYKWMDGSTGVGLRQGGIVIEENRRTGFVFYIPPSTEILQSFDCGVPPGRTFSGASEPYQLPWDHSVLKMTWWTNDGEVGPPKVNTCVYTWVGTEWSISGNNNRPSPFYEYAKFDFDVWNGYLLYQKAGANPGVDNGISEIAMCTPSTGTHHEVVTDQPMFPDVAEPYYNEILVPAWCGNKSQDLCQHLYRYYYMAIGPNARARLELGNAPVYAACGRRRVIPHTTWADNQVVVETDEIQRSGMTHWFITNADGEQQSGLF